MQLELWFCDVLVQTWSWTTATDAADRLIAKKKPSHNHLGQILITYWVRRATAPIIASTIWARFLPTVPATMINTVSMAIVFNPNVLCLATIRTNNKWRLWPGVVDSDARGSDSSFLNAAHAFTAHQTDVALLTIAYTPPM